MVYWDLGLGLRQLEGSNAGLLGRGVGSELGNLFNALHTDFIYFVSDFVDHFPGFVLLAGVCERILLLFFLNLLCCGELGWQLLGGHCSDVERAALVPLGIYFRSLFHFV